ncbi:aminotransferase class V-fold PLP-dependent enzyme, partial [Streptomyces clavuligerus]|uniref:aminotransferase class V-fold PLP-dependent enzyme n=1 Tax=Streptomyces clavuligerus TaxID=1901 RepID=UPI0035ABF185
MSHFHDPLVVVLSDPWGAAQVKESECVTGHFEGQELFTADAGVVPGPGRPRTTAKVEAVLADFFGAEDAALVQGAGTGAIRAALHAAGIRPATPGGLLVHTAPLYPTTRTTLVGMAVRTVAADYGDPAALAAVLPSVRWAYIQHTRQRLGDAYDVGATVAACRAAGVRTIVDDNYAALRVPACGVELGADASCFSLFKLHGPEGVGAVVGARDLIDRIRSDNYSGGGQVQGHQALDALRALTHVPVMWSIQSQVTEEVAERLRAGEAPGVAEVAVANAQDRCLLVRLERPLARELPAAAARLGAAPHPVGANSRYEIAPLVYRLSGSCLEDAPALADWAVRVNPMRAGADLVVDLLRRAIASLTPPGTSPSPGGTPDHSPASGAPAAPGSARHTTPGAPPAPGGDTA